MMIKACYDQNIFKFLVCYANITSAEICVQEGGPTGDHYEVTITRDHRRNIENQDAGLIVFTASVYLDL